MKMINMVYVVGMAKKQLVVNMSGLKLKTTELDYIKIKIQVLISKFHMKILEGVDI